MDAPTPIDLSSWPRREHFAHFRESVPCTYSVTTEIDVTDFVPALRASGRKTYASQIWALATVVNRHPEFRMCLTAYGEPATWPVVHPSFTVFNTDAETFASVWTPYDADFATFHAAAVDTIARYRFAGGMFPQGRPPANAFDISSVPWASFTGFAHHLRDAWDHMAPIFTLGRYIEREGRMLLPLALQIHHAAADGFHSTRLINEFQALMADPSWVQ